MHHRPRGLMRTSSLSVQVVPVSVPMAVSAERSIGARYTEVSAGANDLVNVAFPEVEHLCLTSPVYQNSLPVNIRSLGS